MAEIRRDLLLTVDDLLVFVRHFMKPDMVRSSLQRLLHRHGVGNLRTIILTDNGKEFTDRFCATGERTPTGNHNFDIVCKNNNIEHRLTKPFSPQTNAMVERFNGIIQ